MCAIAIDTTMINNVKRLPRRKYVSLMLHIQNWGQPIFSGIFGKQCSVSADNSDFTLINISIANESGD